MVLHPQVASSVLRQCQWVLSPPLKHRMVHLLLMLLLVTAILSPPPVTAHDQGLGGVDHRRHWMSKMDFAKFDGTDVRIWLDKCVAYFQLYAIPTDFRVTAVFLHMIGKASHWF
jgi:hypothetical protein